LSEIALGGASAVAVRAEVDVAVAVVVGAGVAVVVEAGCLPAAPAVEVDVELAAGGAATISGTLPSRRAFTASSITAVAARYASLRESPSVRLRSSATAMGGPKRTSSACFLGTVFPGGSASCVPAR
jgi:hypothetical protein